MNAISICLYDPTGRQSGETYPPGSIWHWRDGRIQRRRVTKAKLPHENKPLADVDFRHLASDERSPEPSVLGRSGPSGTANEAL
jgi:hypothetical protein